VSYVRNIVPPVIILVVSCVVLAFSVLFLRSHQIVPSTAHSLAVLGLGALILVPSAVIAIAVGRRTKWNGGRAWFGAFVFLTAMCFGLAHRLIGFVNMSGDKTPETKRKAILVEWRARTGKSGGGSVVHIRGLEGEGSLTEFDGSVRVAAIGMSDKEVPIYVVTHEGVLGFRWVARLERVP